ncbi:hypothetical protein [Clostridium diolis]|uniref:Uncharacterized protein n=1 Tax=Clostridium diolis TaxID=223919 RepID=A0AAV3W248_9CLOT|nr:hypothetical protein [Clostridium diolis]QES74447.1 hypothetical protein F3K33_17185 [Clostridium diolis]GEA31673.1 hypothetical protein CDIOL_25960 [Clostridium diolis]
MIQTKLNSRVYYNKSTGDILCFTDEQFNIAGIKIPTIQDDKQKYSVLKSISDDMLGKIELEYGQLFNILVKSKSCVVDIKQEKHRLEVVYYTEDELKAKEVTITGEQIDKNDIIQNIILYAQIQDEVTLLTLENSILEIEKNKILEGRM